MKIVFMGTPDFAVSALDYIAKFHEIILVVTQPDKPVGRKAVLTPPPVKKWAIEHGVEVYQPVKIKEAEAVDYLSKYTADAFVVAAFGQILPKVILDMPRLGCINIHASLLPKYRGAAPIQWAVLNGEKVTGVTTMLMGVGLDDGDILLTEELELADNETGGSLFDRLAELGGPLAVKTLQGLDERSITPLPQDESQATHVGMIKKQLGHLDFSRPAIELERYVRGLNPWPSAFCYLQGKQLKIWEALVVNDSMLAKADTNNALKFQENITPGTVINATDDGILIACGQDALLITSLQLEGKKRMSAADFIRGRAIECGIVLE